MGRRIGAVVVVVLLFTAGSIGAAQVDSGLRGGVDGLAVDWGLLEPPRELPMDPGQRLIAASRRVPLDYEWALEIHASPRRVEAEWTAWFPRSHPVVTALQRTDAAFDSRFAATLLAGQIHVFPASSFRMTPPSVSYRAGSARARMRIRGEWKLYRDVAGVRMAMPGITYNSRADARGEAVRVATEGVRFVPLAGLRPSAQDDRETRFDLSPRGAAFFLEPVRLDGRAPFGVSLREAWPHIRWGLNHVVLGSWKHVLQLVPIFLILWLLGRGRQSQRVVVVHRCLALAAILVALVALQDMATPRAVYSLLPAWAAQMVVHGSGVMGLVVLAVLWPALAYRTLRHDAPAPPRLLTLPVVTLSVATGLLTGVLLAYSVPDAPSARTWEAVSGLSIVLLATWLAVRVVAPRSSPTLLATITTLALLVTAAIDDLVWTAQWQAGSRALMAIAAGGAAAGIVVCVSAALRGVLPGCVPIWRTMLWWGLTTLLLVPVLLLPIPRLVDAEFVLWSTGTTFTSLARIGAMSALLLWLREQSWPLGRQNQLLRATGAIMSALFLMDLATWNGVPIGALVAAWVTWAALDSRAAGSQTPEQGRALMDLLRAERVLATLRRHSPEQVLAFEDGHAGHREAVVALEEELQRQRAELDCPAGVQAVKQQLLSIGPGDGRWHNGRTAAGWGALLGLPWEAWAFWEAIHRSYGAASMSVADVLTSATIAAVRWPLAGFFFGFYYDRLRGRHGLEKGLTLGVVLALPMLFLRAAGVLSGELAWGALYVAVLQSVVHGMLLGLFAGDLETLQRLGQQARSLVEVHNLRYLAAWASSLALAIATAAGTIVSSGVADTFATLGVEPAPSLSAQTDPD